MNLQGLAKAGRVDALNLISVEGGIYLLQAQLGGCTQVVRDDAGKPLYLRSVTQARDLLQGMPVLAFYLVHGRCAR